MKPPMKTPRLRLRLVDGGQQQRFTADGLETFRKRLTKAADILGHDLLKSRFKQLRAIYSGLHVGGPQGDERYYWLGQTLQSQQSRINAAAGPGPSASLKFFPEYDLHLAVTEAGGPKQYAYSFEGVWMMCQINWLWGRELSHFCDAVVEETFDDIKREREQETGEYQARIPKKYERN